MTNIIIMLVLLAGPYLVMRLLSNQDRPLSRRAAAAYGAGALFVFTGIGHFVQTEQLSWMLPEWVPQKFFLVYATGVLEFAIAAGLIIPGTRRLSAVAAIIVLIAFFPANVYAAFQHIPMSGNEWGPIYLLLRGPMQLAIIAWIYWFVLKGAGETMNVQGVQHE